MSIDAELLDCFITEALDALNVWERTCLSISPTNIVSSLDAIFRAAHNLKGSSKSIGLESFGEFIHKVEDNIGQLKLKTDLVTEDKVQKLLEVQAFIVQWLELLKTDPTYNPETKSILNYFVSSDKVTRDQNTHEEMTAENKIDIALNVNTAQVSKVNKQNQNSNETIRVRSIKLDQLIQVIGELGIQQAIVSHCLKEGQATNPSFIKAVSMVTKMAKEIQTQAIGLRMLELQGLFQRLERTGKEIVRELDKKVEFQIEGSDLELDKAVIETITEPLIHIIRNAVDHGIENKTKRLESSKPSNACIKITAKKDTESVLITIEDDGKGLDPEKLKAKAVENGLISAQDNLTDSQCYHLIFIPGFSTAEKVTNVSGRGVGMDVVKQAIDSVSGRVEIESKIGKGSKFTLILPTEMNIIESIVVEVNSERLVIPLNNVVEIIDLKSNQIEKNKNTDSGVLKIREQLIPVENLGNYIRFLGKQVSEKKLGHTPAIIAGDQRGSVAFAVDKVIGQQRVIVKPISGTNSYPSQISGATVLSDGKPGFIIALSNLAEQINKSNRKVAI